MRVGVDRQLGAAVAGQARVTVAEIEAVRLRVDLERHPVRHRRVDDLFELEARAFTAEQPARGRMAEHVDRRMLERLDQTTRGFIFVLLQL